MYEQIRYKEDRIVLILSYGKFYGLTVLFYDDPVKCKGDGDPLVFLDPAVIMGVKISKGSVFIKGIGLDIHPWAVYMGPQYVHAL